MESRQDRLHESIVASVNALPIIVKDVPSLAPMQAKLEEALDEIKELSQRQHQYSRPRSNRAQVTELREEIGRRLRQIAKNATVCLSGLPGIREEVRPPRMKSKTQALIDGTARVLRNIEPHLETLHANGLPRDTVERLEQLSAALSMKANEPNHAMEERARATRALPEALRNAREIIVAIDSSLRVALPAGSTHLKMWERAKRVPGKPGRPRQKRATSKQKREGKR